MKAVFLTGPGRLEIRETGDPACPPDGLVLEVRACGICGSDLRRWKEGPPAGAEAGVPGHEAAGVVIAAGPDCARFRPGDRAAVAPDLHCGKCWYCGRGLYNLCDRLRLLGITAGTPGGLAQKMALSGEVLENGVVHPVPEGLSFDHAALAEPASSVLACHDAVRTAAGDVVVVMGGGPIGCLHLAEAAARGARAVLSEPSGARRRLAERFRPAAVVNPSEEDLGAAVSALTAGVGADIVVCANPVAATQAQAVQIVRKGGTVVLFGGLPKADPRTTLDANRIHYGEIRVVGSFSYHPRFHALALDRLASGALDGEALVTHRFPLADAAAAFEAAASGTALKVLVTL